MSFELNDFTPSEGNYVSKSLLPGTHTCTIIDLKLEPTPYDKEQYNLTFTLEGPELDDEFVGFNINRLDETKGTYKGQIGSVKASAFAFKNWEYKGRKISREESIRTFLGGFLNGIGLLDEFKALAVSADTIQELVEEVKSFLLGKKDATYAFTIAGQRYYKEGSEYPSYGLYFPKKLEGKLPFAIDETDAKFLPYNEAIHITEKKAADAAPVAEVEGFSPPAEANVMFGTPIPVQEFTPGTGGVNDLQLP